jgi:cytochrome c-type biogenesis protein CcmH
MRRSPGLVRAALGVAALLVAAGAAAAARAATLDDRVYAVASRLMCPVCAGQTVAESDSAVAREMRDVIRAKLQAGESPDAIVNFFVGQFGDGVLAEPPRRGLALLLYGGPAAGLAGGLALAVVLIRRWTRAARPAGGPGPGGSGRGPDQTPARPRDAAGGDLGRLSHELEIRDRF